MLHPSNQFGGPPLDSLQLPQIARKTLFWILNLKVNECYPSKHFVPLNWWGKVAFHSAFHSLWVVLCFAQKMLCEDLWEGGREPVRSLLKFIGVRFEVSKSLAIFCKRSIQVQVWFCLPLEKWHVTSAAVLSPAAFPSARPGLGTIWERLCHIFQWV